MRFLLSYLGRVIGLSQLPSNIYASVKIPQVSVRLGRKRKEPATRLEGVLMLPPTVLLSPGP